MMRNPLNPEIKLIILTWVIANLNLFVTGRPAFSAGKGFQVAEDAKGVAAAAHANEVATGLDNLKVVHDFSLSKSNDLQTSTLLGRPQIGSGFAGPPSGSWFSKIPGYMGSSRRADLSLPKVSKARYPETYRLNVDSIEQDLLKFAPTLRDEKAAPLFPEVDEAFKKKTAMVFKGQMEDIKPAEVAELSPSELIRYAADRNSDVENKARKLYEVSDEYTKAERNAFYKASLAFQQESHLDAKEYRKTDAMIRDIVRQKMTAPSFKGISENDMTMSVRRLFIEKISVLYPEVEARLQDLKKAESIYQQAYTDTYQAARQISKSESLEPQALAQLTDRQYVEKAALYDIKAYQHYTRWTDAEQRLNNILNNQDLVTAFKSKAGTSRERASQTKSAQKQLESAKKDALKGADRFYKGEKILKPSALRYERFFRNIM